ncbi:hypothetical protein ACFOUO_02395 [Salinithrix halophila]|uniref:Uncharacterized protein n=1 Tax=Salinithrix halophila TaxID=1485204 RepID=A0ABV8JEF9_9BACL
MDRDETQAFPEAAGIFSLSRASAVSSASGGKYWKLTDQMDKGDAMKKQQRSLLQGS